MVDSDKVATLGLLAGGYLLFTEVRDTFFGPPEWMNEDANEVEEDIQDEMQNPDEIDQLEYQQHAIYYEEQYEAYYDILDGDNRDDIESPEKVRQDIESKNLNTREEAFAWKAAANSLITVAREEESGFAFDIPWWKLLFAGMVLAAIKAGQMGNLGKKLQNWGTDNSGEEGAEGSAAFTTDAFMEEYYTTSAPAVVEEAWGEPEPLDPIVLDPPPEEAGDVVAEGSPTGAIDWMPNWVTDGVESILDVEASDVLTVTEEGAQIIAEATGATVEFLIENPDVTLVLAIALLLVAAAILSPEPVSSALGFKTASYMAGAVGVSLNIAVAKNVASDFKHTVQIG
jgi:hypothetical protein